ncbi:type IV pilus assembly protein PilM [Candidatus Falkowbacteria bacterium]|nr:type IV pilus assembly protein PilM [Candidatus Falkowbacteria bacterium]
MGLFFSKNKNYLGIDIGTSSIKVVELKREGGQARLFSYGFSENRQAEIKNDWKIDIINTAAVINKIWEKAGMTSRNAVAALPAFSVFSSIINLSGVDKKDIAGAVQWEAKKVIPLPLDEMILDWKRIESDGKDDKNIKIFLTGAPRTLVKKYIEIFKEAKINLLSLETETFSLIRSLVGNDKSTMMVVEVGASTTDISIISKGIPMLSRSIDIGGATITRSISNNLNIGIERAEQFKYDLGLGSAESWPGVIPKTINETVSPIINEIKYTLNLFQGKNEMPVEKIILSGGAALLANFADYLSKIVDKKVIIGSPWSRVSCPVDLKPALDEIGPAMSVAIGLALREIE